MILVFGGTTEGRLAVKTLDEGAGSYYYSTRGKRQQVECAHGIPVSGAMSECAMTTFCRQHGIRLIVDAAHPFASGLHATVGSVSKQLDLPVVRLERRYPERDRMHVVWCRDYADAMEKMRRDKVARLLALTGVQTIGALRPFWQHQETFFRILPRSESAEAAAAAGFPASHLVFYEEGGTGRLLERIGPDAILTKESGVSGGFPEKVASALRCGVRVYAVCRPALPDHFVTVDGRHGLRREVERFVPEFYPLHTGFTTGSCATAAATAALTALLSGEKPDEVRFRIPEGETMRMAVASVSVCGNAGSARVIKDAGDDPDISGGHGISVTVAFAPHPDIRFFAGPGVGTVTLPGLGLKVGEAAINPVPRRMMTEALRSLYAGGLDVTVSIEDGEALAARTFNPRVGISGGLSVIGTTGIVQPFSHDAFIESIRRMVRVALTLGCERIVFNSGAKSEGFMKALFPDLPRHAFLHYGNAVGEALTVAREAGVRSLTIGLMLGKAVKLAAGHLDTHSRSVTLDKTFLKSVARQSGCTSCAQDAVDRLRLARELPALLTAHDAARLFPALLQMCHAHCHTVFPGPLHAVLLADDGTVLCQTES